MEDIQDSEKVVEFDRGRALYDVITEYFPDKAEFVSDMQDEGDKISYIYGLLLEMGFDPDTILLEAGVIEEDEA